jgi:manganese transport protein
MWIIAELVAFATDLAEFLGAALGFNLLFGMPLWVAGLLTAVVTFLILGLERYGFRPLEAVITTLVGVVALCYLLETVLDQPAWSSVLIHLVTPSFAGRESVLLATGILGATVMPHVIFLHSALTQDRIVTKNPAHQRLLFRFELTDVLIAMGLAGLVNMAMLIMAASTFFASGDRGGLDRGGASDSRTVARQRRLGRVRRLPACLGSVLLRRRHDGRPGDHAGLPKTAHSALDSASRDDAALTCCDRDRARSDSDARDQPGCALVRTAVRGGPARDVYEPA